MDLFRTTGERFDLSVPIQKYDERTGEFEAWATIEEIDKSNEIIDLDKSFPYFQAHSKRFSDATGGESFGNVREQHDPRKAAGKLIAPPEIRKHDSGARGIYIHGLAVDPGTKEKLAAAVLIGVSIGGNYVDKSEADDIRKGAMRFVADPTEYSLVDNPCVENALITIMRVDGSQSLVKAVGFNPTQGFQCRSGAFHVKKDEARKCEEDHDMDGKKSVGGELKKDDMSGNDDTQCACCIMPSECNCPTQTDDSGCSCLMSCSICESLTCRGQSNAPKPMVPPDEATSVSAKAVNTSAQVSTLSHKAADAEVLQKCLMCVSRLAGIISSAESLAEWLEDYESQDDGDTAEADIADQIEAATSTLYDALRALVDDAQEDAQGEDATEAPTGGNAANAIAASTDYSPVFQMTALAETLKKREGIRKLLTKSVRVHTGNGTSNTATPKENVMKEKEEKAAPAKEEQKPAEKGAENGELSKVATDQIAKAVSDGVTKALEPLTAKVDAIEKSQTNTSGALEQLTKIVAKIVSAPAPAKAVKRVTKAEDGKDNGAEHDKAEKAEAEKTPLEKMRDIVSHPREVAFGSGLVSRATQ